jgi:RimJ/RimL family protein N-acetyltransferase
MRAPRSRRSSSTGGAGASAWTVLLPGGEVIGHAGVQHTTIGDRPEVELLWFIDPDHWNRGYATEMARAAVRVAFDVLALDDVIAFTVAGNAASRAVMEKLGMTYERGAVEGDELVARVPERRDRRVEVMDVLRLHVLAHDGLAPRSEVGG